MGLLDGRIAVVTGSTRGFGLAVAQAFAREGAAVVVSSRSVQGVEGAVDSLCALGMRARPARYIADEVTRFRVPFDDELERSQRPLASSS